MSTKESILQRAHELYAAKPQAERYSFSSPAWTDARFEALFECLEKLSPGLAGSESGDSPKVAQGDALSAPPVGNPGRPGEVSNGPPGRSS